MPGGATDRGSEPPRVLVVCPTYNEIDNVAGHVESVLGQPVRADVLVVDDLSPDGTGQAVRALAAASAGRVRLLERSGRRGLGRAYVAGFRQALAEDRYDVIVQMDVDGSHDPGALAGLVAATQDADLVVGSRYSPGGGVRDWPLRRRALSRWGNRYAQAVLGVPQRDLTSGFKAWRVPLLHALDVPTLRADGYMFQIETTYRAQRLGARLVETPIVFRDRQHGVSKMHAGIAWEAVTSVWRLRRWRPAGGRVELGSGVAP
ncbi:MAG: polyprenol monophosphomannose synthase [Actinomycetota bacterium]|nr:polyprenol monophosphomannose synthase [Actinomycetota bacterium]